MKLSKLFREWLIANCGVKEDATDEELTKAAGDAFANGKLAAEKYLELTKEPEAAEANQFSKKLDQIADVMGKIADHMATGQKAAEAATKEVKAEEPKPEPEKKSQGLEKKVSDIGDSMLIAKETDARVKQAAEQYDGTKSAAVYPSSTKSNKAHPMAGRPVMDFAEEGRPIDEPSQRDKAVVGAWTKFMCSVAQSHGSRTIGFQRMPQHDKELLMYALENMEWSGSSDGGDYADIKHRRLTPHEQKAIIDDAISGGLEAAPIAFDDQAIMAPLLYGELFPLVNTVPIPRGRRIEGVAIGRVTGGWGGVDNTAITLFNTAAFVAAFDTTIYRWQGAITIGLDFLSDTPLNFGQIVTQQYGEALLHDLDDVIAVGNGTTQPEGITVHAGTTAVAWGGATSIGNYESLMFGVAKAELQGTAASSAVFCGNETTYARARALPVGATDARRLFGDGYMGTSGYRNYSLMGSPYKISQSLANTQAFYAVMSKYRMYRREGMTIRTSTEGDTLIRGNVMLIVGMARYGGQLERGACAAITTTAPA